jgi:hypothetical protein
MERIGDHKREKCENGEHMQQFEMRRHGGAVDQPEDAKPSLSRVKSMVSSLCLFVGSIGDRSGIEQQQTWCDEEAGNMNLSTQNKAVKGIVVLE